MPPHGRTSARKTKGLEAAVVDYDWLSVSELGRDGRRAVTAKVAGPAALLIAKTHKIAERMGDAGRSQDKDAHDVYRLLRATETSDLVQRFTVVAQDERARDVVLEGLLLFQELFAGGSESAAARMAGAAEAELGNPDEVAVSTALLAGELLSGLKSAGVLEES